MKKNIGKRILSLALALVMVGMLPMRADAVEYTSPTCTQGGDINDRTWYCSFRFDNGFGIETRGIGCANSGGIDHRHEYNVDPNLVNLTVNDSGLTFSMSYSFVCEGVTYNHSVSATWSGFSCATTYKLKAAGRVSVEGPANNGYDNKNVELWLSRTGTAHSFDQDAGDGVCKVCGGECEHTDKTATTCMAPEKCNACGMTIGGIDSDAHNYTWTYENGYHNGVCSYNDEHTTSGSCAPGEDGNCTVCNASLVASVHTPDKILYFTDADAALKYADDHYAYTVTILKDATVKRGTVAGNLVVKPGVTLTFPSGAQIAIVKGNVSGGGTISGQGVTLEVEGGCSGCTFDMPVENYGTVTGGIFNRGLKNYGTVTGGTIHGTLKNAKGNLDGVDRIGVVHADNITLGTNFSYEADEGTILICTHTHGTPATCVAAQTCPFNCADLDPVDPNAHSLTYSVATDMDNTITETCVYNCAAPATATLEINTDSVTYNGAAQTIETTITYSENWRGERLTAQYENNINVGTAKVYIEKSDVRVEQPFTIDPASIADAVVTFSPTSADYTGSDLTPTVAVRLVGFDDPLVLYTDYEIIWSPGSVTTPGAYTATIKGKGNFQGTVTPAPTFPVNKATPTAANFVLIPPAPESLTYDGTEKKATVAVAADIAGMGDITNITYYNSKGAKVETPTNADTYTVKVDVAEGDYYKAVTGLTVGSYTIEKAIPQTTIGENYSGTYDGQAHIVSVTAQQGATITYGEGINCTATEFPVCKDVGEYKVWYMVDTHSDNYHVINGFVELKITPKSVSVSGITAKDKVYDGTNTATLDCTNATFDGIVEGDILGVTATGSFIDRNVRGENKDNTVNISDLVLTGEDKANYTLDGVAQQETTTAKITPKSITATITVPEGNTYGNVQAPTVTFNGVIPPDTVTGVLTYDGETNTTIDGHYNSTEMPARAGEYTVSVTIRETVSNDDYRNYTLTGATTAQFNIAKADAIATAPVAKEDLVYDGTAQELTTAGTTNGGYTITYRFNTEDTYNDKVRTATDAGTYTVQWKVGNSADPDHNPNQGEITVTIAKADPSISKTPAAIENLTYNGTAQELITAGAASGGELQYKLGENGTWSTDVPKATAAGDYEVYYKVEGNKNYNGVEEQKISVTIARKALTVTVADIADQIWTGSALTPAVITPEGLAAETDEYCTVTYTDNTNVGLATVNVEEKGNYTFTAIEKTFLIVPDESLIDGLTTANVTSADKTDVDKAVAMMNNADLNDAPAEDKADWEALKTLANALQERIEAADTADQTQNIQDAENIGAGNVKLDQKQDLEDALKDLEAAKENYSGNYTQEEKAALEADIKRIEDALAAIERVEDFNTAIDDPLLKEDVKTDMDAATEAAIKDAQAAYGELTDYEKTLIDPADKTKLDTLVATITDYKVTKGDSGRYTVGSGKTLSFTANGPVRKFDYVQVNGKTIASSNYTVTEGSTIITLKSSYLDELGYGKHKIQIFYTDGSTDVANFRIYVNGGNPLTGDNTHRMLFTGIMMTSLLCMVMMVMFVAKKKGKYQR